MTRICSIDGCARHMKARGLCSAHYDRLRMLGSPRPAQPIRKSSRTIPVKDRLMRFVEFDTNNGCWLWTGCLSADGYGRIGVVGQHSSHRAMWTVAHGPIPDGLSVLHRCDTPACCNPNHLFLGTQAENVRDMHDKGRARKARGERNRHAKLTPDRVISILRSWRSGGVSQASLARKHGVGNTAVSRIVNGKSWAHLANIRKEAAQ